MKNDKSKNVIIGLLVVIIIILIGLVILFATGTISFNSNLENTNNQTSKNNDLNENITNNESNDNQILESNKNIYSDIIDEYKQVILEGYKENTNYKYININEYDVNASSNLKYSFYDINKDGKDEMLINNSIIDIFSYDGTNIIRLFKENANCLAYGRCSMELYEDGTIYMRGSSGASSSHISFYTINKNISTLNTIIHII